MREELKSDQQYDTFTLVGIKNVMKNPCKSDLSAEAYIDCRKQTGSLYEYTRLDPTSANRYVGQKVEQKQDAMRVDIIDMHSTWRRT